MLHVFSSTFLKQLCSLDEQGRLTGEEVIHEKGLDTEIDVGYSTTYHEYPSHTIGVLPTQSNLVDLKRIGCKTVGNWDLLHRMII